MIATAKPARFEAAVVCVATARVTVVGISIFLTCASVCTSSACCACSWLCLVSIVFRSPIARFVASAFSGRARPLEDLLVARDRDLLAGRRAP